MFVSIKIFEGRRSKLTVYEALQLMLAFGTFTIVLLTLVVAIIVLAIKK